MSKRIKKPSIFLLVVLFILATIIPPVVAEITQPIPIVRAQVSPNQLVTQAQKLYQNQDYNQALPLWDAAAKGFSKSGDSLNQVMALSNLSLTYQQLGQWQDANNTIQASLKLLNSQPENSLLLAQTLDIQGKLYRETGQAAAAIDTWQQAAAIYQQLDNSTALTQNNLNQAQALQDLGLYPRACQKILASLTIENIVNCEQLEQLTTAQLKQKLTNIATKPTLNTALALRNLGDVLLVIGQPERSRQVLETSLTIAEQLKFPQEIAVASLSLGNTARALAAEEVDIFKRREYQQQALNLYDRVLSISTDVTTQQQAKLNRLSLLIERKKWSDAAPLWQEILSQIDNLPHSRDRVYAQINFAHILIELLDRDNPQPPEDIPIPNVSQLDLLLTNAVQNARNLGDKRSEAYALGNLGRLYELTGELSIAQTYTNSAIALTSSVDAADVAYQYFWQLGRIQKLQGDLEKAIASYTKAFNYLQSLRGDIAIINPEVQFSFRDAVEPVYRQLVELDLEYAQQLERAGNKQESTAKLIQARDVIESLQLAQLNNFFREACIDGKPQQIDAIDPNAAVIYPIVLSNKLEVLLSLPKKDSDLNRIRLYSLEKTQAEISEVVNTIKSSLLSAQSLVENNLPQYQQVYDWLIRPFETELTDNKIQTIAFVLDGDLRNIPMSVLHDGNQYLVEKYALALTPGLQLLEPKPLTAIELNAIAAGLSENQNNLAPLPGVEVELKTIQKIGLTKEYLLNSQFKKKTLKQNITTSGSPIIHLATHAQFSSKAEDTFILSWDGPINIKELDDLLRDDTFNRKNDIELLVLSACETASGDPRATLGLAGVAVQAGARSTLATLWSVVDPSTAKIMEHFYQQLKLIGTTKANKAEALQKAQLKLLNDDKFKHPHFWAPFILVGNWQ
ncbi:MAG: CHAT domain-containing protein [Pleurocapsa sp. MO_226.B13]|nr:CHAT domain-containing protein [Pleurocapsa sp. MO_226.B13]